MFNSWFDKIKKKSIICLCSHLATVFTVLFLFKTKYLNAQIEVWNFQTATFVSFYFLDGYD